MDNKVLIVDGHLDLSMNAMEWNRDLRWPVNDIRLSERGMTDKPDRGKGTVSFPSMQSGNVFLCMATQIARSVRPGSTIPGWNSPEQAWSHTQGQLAWYREMEECRELIQIRNVSQLEKHIHQWQSPTGRLPVGYILSLEGADSIVSIKHLEAAYNYGLRAIGLSHYGPGIYAGGTDSEEGLNARGKDLLKEIGNLKIILDASHLNDVSFREVMDHYDGPVWASHNNCRKFVPHNRQFTDEQIRELIGRDAVIGVALDAWMLVPEWRGGISTPENRGVSLKQVIQNIGHICQLAGDSLHAGIGSDLDGAFGREQSPVEIDTIADLQKIPPLLSDIGFSDTEIINIMSGNWIRFLKKNLGNN
ncbi:MAG: membrane dipeptidase [Bacteroidota bacterium]|nr:membrane dipeptidase [Bacteroidota bacterium]